MMSAYTQSTDIKHIELAVNGTRLHVAVSGPDADAVVAGLSQEENDFSDKVVFCLHGFPEGWMGWRPLMRLMPAITFVAPDLRGYTPSEIPQGGFDVFTLTDDIKALIDKLGLIKPILLSHDWGGALGWIFAHRYPEMIERLIVVNCTHPRTLVRAVFRFEDWQTLRIPWVPPFQIPYLPERLVATKLGRKLLELSFTLREGSEGNMDRDLVREMVRRFQTTHDARGPIDYYRDIVKTLLIPKSRKQLSEIYDQPISLPVTLIWGMEDEALSSKVAQKSYIDAGCDVEWRPLKGIGHFVDLEAPEKLAQEVARVIALAKSKPESLRLSDTKAGLRNAVASEDSKSKGKSKASRRAENEAMAQH